MPRYLYSFIELFGYTGSGTPEDPGTDFGMSVWIDAQDKEAAFLWGNHLLEHYLLARFRFVPPEESVGMDTSQHGQAPRRLEGWIEEDESALEQARECGYPECRVGEVPVWDEPWRIDNARKGRREGPSEG